MRPIMRGLWALLLGFLPLAALAVSADAAPSGPPIRIGGSLALTGALASTGIIHKIVGEISVDQLNKKNGLLGRPVEYVLVDDQSKPELARTLYERLVTVDKVDLIIGAFGTAANLSAMAVAQRYQKVLITNTMGNPVLSTYEWHFPTQGLGADPERTFMNLVLDGLASTGNAPRTIAILTSKFPSVQFISVGGREVAQKRGVNVVLYLEYEFGNRDFGPIAARVKEANPDLVWVGALGLDGNLLLEAFDKISYKPRGHYYMFPASAPLLQIPSGRFALSMSPFEEHRPFTDNPVAAEYIKVFNERAAKAGISYTKVENQAAIGYTTWQTLEAAVTATKSLDQSALARWLKANEVDTIIGKTRFHGKGNFGDTLYRVRQIQDGRWVIVWPKEWAPPGTRVVHPVP